MWFKDGDVVAEELKRMDLLPGPTAKQWARYGLIACGVFALGCLGGVVWALAVVTRTQRWDLVVVMFLAIGAVGLLCAWIFVLLSDRKEKSEMRAGYTTVAQGNNEVVRLHSTTGVVMREAGRPNLSRSEWEAAMRRVRAFQAGKDK